MKRALTYILLLTAALFTATAQDETYKFDFGGGIGMSGYLGDTNESNMFAHPGFEAQLSFRYQIDARWALRTVFTTASLSGNTADLGGLLPHDQEFTFHSQIYDLGCRAEFNFFPYGIGETYKRLRRWTPYMALGLGMTLSNTKPGTYAALSIPMAFGVKFKARPRVNLGLEWCMTKTIGDKVDGLSDLYQVKSSFLKNNDWHSGLVFSVSYEFGERCATCHYVD